MKKLDETLSLQEITATKENEYHLGERKHKRYKPVPNTPALIDMINSDSHFFEPTLLALVTEESYGGVRVVMAADFDLNEKMILKLKVGQNPPVLGEIRWLQRVDDNTVVLGLMYVV